MSITERSASNNVVMNQMTNTEQGSEHGGRFLENSKQAWSFQLTT